VRTESIISVSTNLRPSSIKVFKTRERAEPLSKRGLTSV
jgi:hypothetical protein